MTMNISTINIEVGVQPRNSNTSFRYKPFCQGETHYDYAFKDNSTKSIVEKSDIADIDSTSTSVRFLL